MKQSSDEQYLIKIFCESCCDYLSFDCQKIEVEKTESPDFVLHDRNRHIGVEITKALDQNLQKAVSIRDEKFKSVPFCPTLFEDESMSGTEIKGWLEKSKTKLIGKPYKGDGLEEKTACNIIKAIEKKIIKFKNYTKYDYNILLIYVPNRVTLEHDITINIVKKYTPKHSYSYICLKLGAFFYFLQDNEVNGDSVCPIKA